MTEAIYEYEPPVKHSCPFCEGKQPIRQVDGGLYWPCGKALFSDAPEDFSSIAPQFNGQRFSLPWAVCPTCGKGYRKHPNAKGCQVCYTGRKRRRAKEEHNAKPRYQRTYKKIPESVKERANKLCTSGMMPVDIAKALNISYSAAKDITKTTRDEIYGVRHKTRGRRG